MTENDYSLADTDIAKGHPLLIERWPRLRVRLLDHYGWAMRVIEVYRPELRQQWLFGQGRTVGQLQRYGITFAFARPSQKIVTNAWSAKVSAHGLTRTVPAHGFAGGEITIPAAAALDVVPLGPDERPWTEDDPWDPFVRALALEGPDFGLVHFTSHGKVTDRPHLQLVEWNDGTHTLEAA